MGMTLRSRRVVGEPVEIDMDDLGGLEKGKIKRKQRAIPSWVDSGFWFLIWYSTSVICNNTSKELVPLLGSGRILTLMQLFTSSIIGSILLISGVLGVSFKSFKNNEFEIWSLGAIFALAFLSLNMGMQFMHVSMAMVLRATEPLFAVAIVVMRGGGVSFKILLTLVVIVLGAGMSAFNEPEFSTIGLVLLFAANVGFTLRSIVAKKIKEERKDIDNVNLFVHCCIRGTIVQAIIVLVLDLEGMKKIPSLLESERFLLLALMNSVAYFSYLQASFIVLSKIGVVSHTVGNSLRRPVCIGFAVVYFGNPVSPIALMGIVLACIGAGMYSILKSLKPAGRK